MSHRHWRPANNPRTVLATPRLGTFAAPSWLTSTWCCKNFKIRESQQIEFRSEFFNILNHPNFGLPGGGTSVYVDVPGGAAITSTATDNRQIEFALKYTF